MYVMWKSEKLASILTLTQSSSLGIASSGRKGVYLRRIIPITASVAITVLVAVYHIIAGSRMLAGYIFIGFVVGFVIQRSGFCFATAFRDLIKGPEQRRARDIHLGIILGLFLSTSVVAVLKSRGFIDPLSYVNPVSIYNVIGGILFAIGFTMVGGCASGMLWRLGEGNLRVVPGIVTTVLTYPIAVRYIQYFSAGPRITPVLTFGYEYGITLIYAFLLIYAAFVISISKFSKH